MHTNNLSLAIAPSRALAAHPSSEPRRPETTTLTADEIRRIVHDIVG